MIEFNQVSEYYVGKIVDRVRLQVVNQTKYHPNS